MLFYLRHWTRVVELQRLFKNFSATLSVSLMVGGRKRRSPDMAAVLQPYTAILSSSSRHIESLCCEVTGAGAGLESQTRALAYLKPHSTPLIEGCAMSLRKQRCEIGLQPVSWRGPNITSHSETHPASRHKAREWVSKWMAPLGQKVHF